MQKYIHNTHTHREVLKPLRGKSVHPEIVTEIRCIPIPSNGYVCSRKREGCFSDFTVSDGTQGEAARSDVRSSVW
jgi:hypothetical protein